MDMGMKNRKSHCLFMTGNNIRLANKIIAIFIRYHYKQNQKLEDYEKINFYY